LGKKLYNFTKSEKKRIFILCSDNTASTIIVCDVKWLSMLGTKFRHIIPVAIACVIFAVGGKAGRQRRQASTTAGN